MPNENPITLDGCTPNNPLASFESNGAAPTLKYNIPQSSELTLFGRVAFPTPIDQAAFKSNGTAAENDAFWDQISSKNPASIKQDLVDLFLSQGSSRLNFNYFHNLNLLLKPKFPVVIFDSSIKLTNGGLVTGLDAYKVIAVFGNKSAHGYTEIPLGNNIKAVYFQNNDAQFSSRHFDINTLVSEFSQRKKAFVSEELSGVIKIDFVTQPNIFHQFHIMLEMKIASFLGNYGAGKTISTFSLLPGEKTTISIRTYRDSETTKSRTENILDSFGQNSVEQFDKTMKDTVGHDSSTNTSSEWGRQWDAGGKAEVNLGFFSAGGGGGVQNQKSESFQSAVNSFSVVFSETMNKHMNETNSQREINVNTTTQETVKEGFEQSVVRVLENPNESRTLNFVFREMLQQYNVVTYLHNIKFAYSDGTPNNTSVVGIRDLKNLVYQVIKSDNPTGGDTARNLVFNQLVDFVCTIFNYKDEGKKFFVQKTFDRDGCASGGTLEESFWVKNPVKTDAYPQGLIDDTEVTPGNELVPGLKIHGVIMDIKSYTLRTPSLVVDSVLGQGNALDCFNSHLQNESVIAAQLENERTRIENETLEAITDPLQRAEAYRKMFGAYADQPPVDVNVDVNTNSGGGA
jgi:hypothetical protein